MLLVMVLYWVQVVFVVWLFWFGWMMVDLLKGVECSVVYGLYKLFGLFMLLLVVVCFGWWQCYFVLVLLLGGWEVGLVCVIYYGFYFFLLMVLLVGYLVLFFMFYVLKFFGIEIVKVGWLDELFNGFFKLLYQIMVWGGVGLIVLYLVGVVKYVIKGEGILM